MVKRVVYLALFIVLLSFIVISHGESNEVSEVAELNLNYVYHIKHPIKQNQLS